MNCALGPFECIDALTQLDSIVIRGISVRRFSPSASNFDIREILILLGGNEGLD
jgi:hypothetical protein